MTDPIKALIAAAQRVSVAWRSNAVNPFETGRAVSALESAIVAAEARPEPAAEPSEFDVAMGLLRRRLSSYGGGSIVELVADAVEALAREVRQ